MVPGRISYPNPWTRVFWKKARTSLHANGMCQALSVVCRDLCRVKSRKVNPKRLAAGWQPSRRFEVGLVIRQKPREPHRHALRASPFGRFFLSYLSHRLEKWFDERPYRFAP